MAEKKQSDSTRARRGRSGPEQCLDDAPLADAPELELPRLSRMLETAATSVEVDEEIVGRTATKHCILNYPTLYTAGVPELSSPRGEQVWVVPIVLRSPIHGTLGTVGEIRIDARSGKIIDIRLRKKSSQKEGSCTRNTLAESVGTGGRAE
jgi:hypothetical protein